MVRGGGDEKYNIKGATDITRIRLAPSCPEDGKASNFSELNLAKVPLIGTYRLVEEGCIPVPRS
jgi:hypothetical protein